MTTTAPHLCAALAGLSSSEPALTDCTATDSASMRDGTQSNTAFSFVAAEHQMLAFWQEQQIFQQSLRQTSDQPAFVFYDGPPFATGLPHHGHLVASTIKDIIPRYQTMRGFHVSRRFGWDCHGLPIEHEIDKKLGMSAREAVSKLGLKAYNDHCRSIVQRYTGEWETIISRLGRWVDFANDYRTMEPWYMESVWWVFQQLWQQGLVYQSEKVVAYSTALETVLSNFEASSNYKEVQDPAITVLFPLAEQDGYFAAWTTTPWTLPANVALCVNPKLDYVKVLDPQRNQAIWFAAALLPTRLQTATVLAQVQGAALAGLRYLPVLPNATMTAESNVYQLLCDDFVSADSGTGIVHLAPAFGEDDQRVCRAHQLKVSPCPLDSRGHFSAEMGELAGLYLKDADKVIIQRLKQSALLYQHESILHSYPFCPRTDTPIIYRAVPSWFIRVEPLRDKLVANNQHINWVPAHIQHGRMGKWLENASDWAVSRNRYWGTPLPIWVNQLTGHTHCVGSVAELQALTGADITDLHRDHIDELTFSLPDQPGCYRRVPEVFDCWFESGAMPYAQVHYPFENKQQFEDNFPAAFIAEGVDQTRGWFYTLQVLSECLFGKPAFTNVIVNGLVLAEDGRKMSKRLQNYTAPTALMEQYGADALRLYLINSGLVKAEEQRFADAGVQDMVRQVLLPWLNGYKFFQTYADIDQWQRLGQPASHNILDQWILSRLQSLIDKVNAEMQAYRLYEVVPPLFAFLEDLTNWYIRLNRSRFWQTELNEDKQHAYATLYHCLCTFGTLMAPLAPFLADYLYQQLKRYQPDPAQPISVHLASYPEAKATWRQPALEQSLQRCQQLVVMGRQLRNDWKIRLKTPLSSATILHPEPMVLAELSALAAYIRAELNIKELCFSSDEHNFFEFSAKANFALLGQRLGSRMKHFAALIAAISPAQMAQLRQQGRLQLDDQCFDQSEILLQRKAKTGVHALAHPQIGLALDFTLTPALIAEGKVREVISRIQQLRKQHGLAVTDKIQLSLRASATLQQVLQAALIHLQAETLCTAVDFALAADAGETLQLEQDWVAIKLWCH
jgi:isoleucyl-tRNA synthetase